MAFYSQETPGQIPTPSHLTFSTSESGDGTLGELAIRLGMFDAYFYTAKYGAEMREGETPFGHFMRVGWERMHDPSPYFDYRWYANAHMNGNMAENALAHYLNIGRKLKYLPKSYDEDEIFRIAEELSLFDSCYYFRLNSDACSGTKEAFSHFMRCGWKEGRNPSSAFDLCWYVFEYLEGLVSVNPLLHYLAVGRPAGLKTRPPEGLSLPSCPRVPAPARKRRICLFAGYNFGGKIHEYVIQYIRELSRYADVYYLADNYLPDTELRKLEGIVREAWGCVHGKRDFGAWSIMADKMVGWETIAVYDELLLVNDSCFLIRDLSQVFAKMDSTDCDWWGLQATKGLAATMDRQGLREKQSLDRVKQYWLQRFESEDIYDFHVGSYFLAYRKNIIMDQAFRNILGNIINNHMKDKFQLIRMTEVGITRWLISHGYNFATFIDAVYPGHPIFSATYFEQLLPQGFPLLKRYFLVENHYHTPFMDEWKKWLVEYGVSSTELVENYINEEIADDKLCRNWTFDYPDSINVFVRKDALTPKYRDWYVFVADPQSGRLGDNCVALFQHIRNLPAIKKIVLTFRKRIQLDGENVHIVSLHSGEGQYYLSRAGNVFVEDLPKDELMDRLPRAGRNIYCLQGVCLPISLFPTGNNSQIARFRKIIASSDVDRLAKCQLFRSMLYADIEVTGMPCQDLLTGPELALPAFMRRELGKLNETLGGRKLVLIIPHEHDAGRSAFNYGAIAEAANALGPKGFVFGIYDKCRSQGAAEREIVMAGYEILDLSGSESVITLMRRANALVTDYNARFVDFLCLGRPTISLWPENAASERDQLEEWCWLFPGSVCLDGSSLIAILNGCHDDAAPDRELYLLKSRLFNQYSGSGNCDRVIDLVQNNIGDERTRTNLRINADGAEKNLLFLGSGAPGKVHSAVPFLEAMGWRVTLASANEVAAQDFEWAGVTVVWDLPLDPVLRDYLYEFRLRNGKIIYWLHDILPFDDNLGHSFYYNKIKDIRPYYRNCVNVMNGLRMADVVITPSQAMAEYVRGHGVKAIPIYDSLEDDIVKKYGIPSRRNIYSTNISILCYLENRPAYDDVALCLGAMQEIKTVCPTVKINVAGYMTSRLEECVAHGLFSRAVFENDAQFHAALEETDILLLPRMSGSLNAGQNPIPVAAAALHHAPAIVTPLSSLAEVMRHGVNGLFATPPEEWNGMIASLMLEPSRLRELGQKAHETILPLFLPKRWAEMLAACINSLHGSVQTERH